jgi:hypothetical protein
LRESIFAALEVQPRKEKEVQKASETETETEEIAPV